MLYQGLLTHTANVKNICFAANIVVSCSKSSVNILVLEYYHHLPRLYLTHKNVKGK